MGSVRDAEYAFYASEVGDLGSIQDVKAAFFKKYPNGFGVGLSRSLHDVPVATKAHPPADGANATSTGGVLGGTAKLNHVATRSFYGVRLVYVNWGAGTGSKEAYGANDITVRAAVEPFGNTVVPVTFNGKRSVTIEPGGTAISDPLGLDIAKGASFSTRTFVQITAGTFPINTIPTASSGEGNNYANPAGADLTAPGSASLTGIGTNQLVYGPAAILGQVADLGKPVIGILGDSIFHGNGDSSFAFGGLAQRALNGDYSYQKVAFPGESLGGFLGVGGVGRIGRAGILALCGITHIVTDYTVNSLTSANIQSDAVTAWTVMRRMAPYGVYATTLTPQTTSTDGWATVGNQTVQYPADREPRRIAFNSWLRDGAPIDNSGVPQAVGSTGVLRAGQAGHPLSGYFEVADLAETTRNSGIWKAGYSADGTHPNATGHAALAAAIKPAVFGPISA